MISVIIPLYNKAHTIVNTLTTVMKQTYNDFEVIIVNDGSTDNGVEVINSHFHDSKITIINQKNAGVSAARNRGVDESKGEWIAFLDGDDEWHPKYLETMYNLIQKYPDSGLFLCGGLIHNANGSTNIRIAKGYEGFSGHINLFENPPIFSHTSATIVNKSLFNKTHRFLENMTNYEDYLASQAIACISPVVYCGLPLTKYNGGITGQLTQMNLKHPQKFITDITLYYNTILQDYQNAKIPNNFFYIFIKYSIRHNIKLLVKEKKEIELTLFIKGLSKDVIKIFPSYEFIIYNTNSIFTLLWINFTKIIWRKHKFPIMGQSINTHKIPTEYINW